MSQNWKKRSWGFRPSLTTLEDRSVPAGNLRVLVDDGVLRIRSDNDDFHAFNISGAGGDNVVIRPAVGTTINGKADAVFIRGVHEGFDIQTGNGADSIVISGVKGQEYLSIVTNGGDDVVHIVDDTRSLQSTWVRTGDGNDLIIINGNTFRRHFAIVAGEGDDRVDVGPRNRFGNNVTFDGGGGTNTLNQTGNDFHGTPRIVNFSSQSNGRAPIAVNDATSVSQSNSVSVNVLANDTAVEGTLTPSSVKIVSVPASGTALVNSDGTITYTAGSSSATSDTFTYTVQNSGGATSNAATVTVSITDGTGPVPTLASTAKDQTNVTPIPVTLSFNEAVTGLEKADFAVTNGTLSDITTVSATQFTFTVAPTGQGAVTVQLPAGKVTDNAGNSNTASSVLTRTFDSTAPAITVNPLTTNDTTPTLTGTVNDGTSTVVVTVNGQTANASISGTTWTATLATALADGKYSIVANATDPAGNVGTANLADGLVIETVPPTVTVSSSLTSPTITSPIPITVTFNENVTGFTIEDVTVTNGSASSFVASNEKVYTFNVTPTGGGVVTVAVAANKATDIAGNGNAASNTFSITFDDSASPGVTISSTASASTNANPIPFTVTFTEAVTGFEIGDIQTTNGTPSNFVAVNGTTYTFSVVPVNQGDVTVNIAAGVAQDGGGQDNTAAAPFTRTFDSIAPDEPVIDQKFTNLALPTITGALNEEGLTASVTANNETVQAVVTGLTFTATFTTPFADGKYDVTAVAKDAAGNSKTAFLDDGLVVDTVAPTVQITSSEDSPTAVALIPISINFSEQVIGFQQSDILLTNGTVSDFFGNGILFTFNVTPAADGEVAVSLAAGSITDRAGNPIPAAEFTIVSDQGGPTTTVSTTAVSPTNSTSLPFTVAFSEAVTLFRAQDVTITNGSLSNFSAVDAKTFTFTVTPVDDSTVEVSVAAGVTKDLVGNSNTASQLVSIVSDRTAPSVVITTTASSPTSAVLLPFTVTFSEDVTGFEAGDVTITNGTLSNFVVVSNSIYTFDVTPTADGDVSVAVAAAVAKDAATNDNTAATTVTVAYNAAPRPMITTSSPSPTNAASLPFTVTFSEDVTDFTDSDVGIANGTLSNFVVVNGTTYTFDVAPTADGDVTVSVAAGVAKDANNNDNTAAPDVVVVSDRSAPTPVIATTAISPSNSATLPFTVDFGESVVGFTDSDVGVTGGTVSNFIAVSGSLYSFDVTPTADGTVTVSIAAAVAADTAGNDNLVATDVSVVSDRTLPTTVVSTSSASPTNASEIPFTVTFGENVAGFEDSDITVANGTVTNFIVVDGATYTFMVVPAADGDVTVSVAADVAQDTAANGNAAGAAVTVVSDRTGPVTTITTSESDPSAEAVLKFTATFAEAVSDFVAGDITVTNGSVSNFLVVDAFTYTFDVTPTTDGEVIVSVAAGVAIDGLGNGNLAATDVSIVSDRSAPTGTINTSSTGAITGTALDSFSGIASVQISIFNGVAWWDGTAFNSASEVFVPATTSNGFADWTLVFAAGSYTVNARITDGVGIEATISASVVVS